MKQILWQLVTPLVALVAALVWWQCEWRGVSLNEVPLRGDTFVTSPYAVCVFLGMAVALAISRVRPHWALGLAAFLLIVQLVFWPARFSQTSWIAYVVLLPLVAVVSRRIRPEFRRRVFLWILLGAAAVAALLSFPSLSMNGRESSTYGKGWAVEPAVVENITVWVVLCLGLVSGAWALGRPRSGNDEVRPVSEAVMPGVSNEAFSALTPREQDTFMLVARGRSNAEIAQRLFITEATVKTHVGSLLTKLGLTSRSRLIAYAYDQGIILPARNAAAALSATGGPHRDSPARPGPRIGVRKP
jgi:DNA-binding CsgD family transcriptional regulator